MSQKVIMILKEKDFVNPGGNIQQIIEIFQDLGQVNLIKRNRKKIKLELTFEQSSELF